MTATLNPTTLNEQFGIPHVVRFEAGPGDLVRAVITGETSTGVVYLHGAHVAEYQPVGQKDVLFMSRSSEFRDGRPIRGGVPICFPWFGAKANDPGAPGHGVARLRQWDLVGAVAEGDNVTLELATHIEPFDLSYRVTFGPSLTLALTVHNTSQFPASFEEALHTYFSVSQIGQAQVRGLEGCPYLDKTQQMQRFTQPEAPLTFDGEVDRIYVGHTGTVTLVDPGFGRTIRIEKENSASTIVWDPWTEKAGRMPDFGDEEWATMLCIETGNVGDDRIELAPDERHTLTTTITAVAD